jgi:hypothetical protein
LIVTIDGGFAAFQELFIFLSLGFAMASTIVTESAVRQT